MSDVSHNKNGFDYVFILNFIFLVIPLHSIYKSTNLWQIGNKKVALHHRE